MELSFNQAAMQFFGKKEGQSLGDFMKECRALTPKDRADMTPGLEKALDCKIKPE